MGNQPSSVPGVEPVPLDGAGDGVVVRPEPWVVIGWGQNEFDQDLSDSDALAAHRRGLHPCVMQSISRVLEPIGDVPKQMICGRGWNVMLTESGNVFTWGNSLQGVLGRGPGKFKPKKKPRLIHFEYRSEYLNGNPLLSGPTRIKIVKICAQPKLPVIVALSQDGQVFQWGRVWNTSKFVSFPQHIFRQGQPRFKDIEVACSACLAVSEDNRLYCCGDFLISTFVQSQDAFTQIPLAFEIQRPRAMPDLVIKQIAIGSNFCLILTDNGKVFGFGSFLWCHSAPNSRPRHLALCQMSDVPTSAVIEIEGLRDKNIIKIAASQTCALALDESGVVYSWGFQDIGALGQGSRSGGLHSWEFSRFLNAGTFLFYYPEFSRVLLANHHQIVDIMIVGLDQFVHNGRYFESLDQRCQVIALTSDGTLLTWGYCFMPAQSHSKSNPVYITILRPRIFDIIPRGLSQRFHDMTLSSVSVGYTHSMALFVRHAVETRGQSHGASLQDICVHNLLKNLDRFDGTPIRTRKRMMQRQSFLNSSANDDNNNSSSSSNLLSVLPSCLVNRLVRAAQDTGRFCADLLSTALRGCCISELTICDADLDPSNETVLFDALPQFHRSLMYLDMTAVTSCDGGILRTVCKLQCLQHLCLREAQFTRDQFKFLAESLSELRMLEVLCTPLPFEENQGNNNNNSNQGNANDPFPGPFCVNGFYTHSDLHAHFFQSCPHLHTIQMSMYGKIRVLSRPLVELQVAAEE